MRDPEVEPAPRALRVYVDAEGVLRTDHELRVFSRMALRLHYKLVRGWDRRDGSTPASAPG